MARQYRPKKMYRKRRAYNVKSFASDKQTIELAEDPAGTIFRMDDIALSQFDRLSHIARAYQYYRITKVEVRYKPLADTFQTLGGQTTGSVPYLYWLQMKTDTLSLGATDFNALRDAGARATRLDDKSITRSFRPAANISVAQTEGVPNPNFALYKTSPWLSTNFNANAPGGSTVWVASAVPHQGCIYGVEQDFVNPNTTLQYGVEVTIHVQFKKPLQFSVDPGAEPCPKKELIAT